MEQEIISHLIKYGYLAIFVLIFLQEIGMPNLFPNEILLLFAGFLSSKGILSLPLVIITAIIADFAGTNVLFFLFYFSGPAINLKLSRWMPGTISRIENFGNKTKKWGRLSFYVLRITPFTRGYISIFAGLSRTNPAVYLTIVAVSSVIWASGYSILGNVLGLTFNLFPIKASDFRIILMVAFLIMISLTVLMNVICRGGKSKNNLSGNSPD